MSTNTHHAGVLPAEKPASFGRLLFSLLFANVAMYVVYISVLQIFLPQQVELLDPANKVTNFGIVSGISAIVATVANPLAGALSDKTRSRFGRRTPWILGGGLGALLALMLLGNMQTLFWITVAWCLVQATMNCFQSAITAIIPERVAAEKRGTASAVVGIGVPIGSIAGVALASMFAQSLLTGYTVIGLIIAVVSFLFVALNHEPPLPAEEAQPALKPSFAPGRMLADFFSSLSHRDFAWAFASRALIMLGYFLVSGYQLYLLKDYIKLEADQDPATLVVTLTTISTVAMVVATLLGGLLSDKLGRRKIFVGVAALLMAGALLIPFFSPTFAAMMLFSAINGFAFGCYNAVDTALITLVLPDQENNARDLGILNLANAGPQIIAPFIAAVVISSLGGYSALFVSGAALALGSAAAIIPVRSVR